MLTKTMHSKASLELLKKHLHGNRYFRGFLIFIAIFTLSTMATRGDDAQKPYKYDAFFSYIRDRSPILIPPCDSPRATLKSFYEITQKIKIVFKSSELGRIKWEQESKLISLYSQLRYLVDYNDLSQKERFAKINVKSSQLSEILDRIPVPKLSAIPDAKTVAREKLEYWRIPNTEISLISLPKGARKGDWVFSPETMSKMASFYEVTQTLPYLSHANVGEIRENCGLLEHYMSFTGSLIPTNTTQYFPKWMFFKFFQVPLWKFFASFFIVLALLVVTICLYRVTRFHSDRERDQNGIFLNLRRLILPLSLTLIIPMVVKFITEELRIRLIPLDVIDDTLWCLFFVVAFWLCLSAGNLISVLIIRTPSFPQASFDVSLVRILCRITATVFGSWIIFKGLGEIGVSMVPLVAGASVGGLAFALAVKPTLSNIISGMLIYADKPFAIGERIAIKDFIGNVESIGLRSTRIRTLDGHLVSIPNDEVCNSDLENISERPSIKRKFGVTITYDTPPKKIKLAMDIIRQLLSIDEDKGMTEEELGRPPNSCVNADPKYLPRVYFDELNADSLNLLVIYYFSPPDYYKSLEYATWFNSELIERFNNEKISFAFPTQTIEYKPVE